MHDIIQDYYGRQLQHSGDLKTSACCDVSQVPAWLKLLLARIHPEVLSRYYGCGLVCPPLLEGAGSWILVAARGAMSTRWRNSLARRARWLVSI